MIPIGAHLIGRFGNQCFQYAYARKLAEQQGRELHTNAWAGQKIFQLNEPPLDGSEEMLPEHYRQDQDSLIYTRADARRWFAWRPEVAEKLPLYVPRVMAHLRRGDFFACGYPVVGFNAIVAAVLAHGFGKESLGWAMEESPYLRGFSGELSFVPDFWRLCHAEILFRSNSSFSWWAATLGNGRVFSPIIEGLQGGVEHDAVPFVEGNWPRLAELPGITDLHLIEDEKTRKWLYEKEFAKIPRWIGPDDPLPEIPNYLKP